MINTFSDSKRLFDDNYIKLSTYKSFLPIHLTHNKKVSIKNSKNKPNEEYYKWQFLISIVDSGMYAKDFIGTEIHLPKGNKKSSPIKIDACIFDDKSWFSYYQKYHKENDYDAINWLRQHLIATIEIKKEDAKDIESVWNKQLKSYIKESEREFCLGVIYDTERLFLFKKSNNKYLRLNDEYNTKGEKSGAKEISLHLPDPYINIPNFDTLIQLSSGIKVERQNRTLKDLRQHLMA